jgi:hypothetical protein
VIGFVRDLFNTTPKPVAVILVVLLAILAVATFATIVIVAVDVIRDPGGHWNLDWTTRETPRR